MQVTGQITIGEGTAYAGKAAARLYGHPRPTIISNVVIVAVMALIMLLFAIARELLAWPGWLYLPALLISAILGTVTGLRVARRYAVNFSQKALASRGMVSPVPSRFELSDQGLTSISGRMTMQAPWSAISEVVLAGPYWVILAESYSLYLPRRFFASSSDEKTFLREMLRQMQTGAQERSVEAARVANN